MFSIKNKINVYTLLLAITATVTGCKKLVDIDAPIDTVGTGIIFKSDANAATAIAGLYSYMIYNDNNPCMSNSLITLTGGLMADELVPTQGMIDVDGYQLYSNKVLLTNAYVDQSMWGPTYKQIYIANALLEGEAASTAKEFTDSARNQVKAEARLAKGFSYFYLYNLYGAVPLVNSTDVVTNANLSRSPVEEVKKQVEEDLLYAYNHLPTNYSISKGEKTRPNSYLAAALLARFYLYEKRWADAIAMADYVINSGQFALTTPDKTFRPNSTEAIWQLKSSSRNGLKESAFLSPILDNTGMTPEIIEMLLQTETGGIIFQLLPQYCLQPELAGLFQANDLRTQSWTRSVVTPVMAPFSGETYVYANKHPRFDVGAYAPTYYTVARLAELYLIRAEAKAQQNDVDGAVTDLNMIRTRAGLADTDASGKENVLEAIMKERRIELFAEWGHRWFDLKRTGKSATVLGAIEDKKPWSDNYLLLFIPTADLRNGPFLTQNPGYSK